METTNLGKSIKEIFNGQYKYVVPLYQRNFAWRQEHIEQLLQDVYEAYNTYKGNNNTGNYFIGSLVVLKRSNGDFEVIDGQQRLTTLSLITKIMGINEEPRLFYDSRPEVEEFFKAFYKSEKAECNIDYPQTFHLRNAIDYIKETKLDAEDNGKTIFSVEDGFKSYFANNVILVRVEIPQDTDVASYFEIMNNRGEQLQKHEIFKSYLMSKLDDRKRQEFALIWDACSQMDIPIQKSFKAGDENSVGTRNHYFGNNYDEFHFIQLADDVPVLSDTVNSQNEKNDSNKENENSFSKDSFTINDIIDETISIGSNGDKFPDDEEYISDFQYKSIIDFPNFLMHVFKILFSNRELYSDSKYDIPLNEKFLLSKYKEIENDINPMDFAEKFIATLFYCRTVYDRYIVKTTVDEKDSEDGEKWELIKPKKYDTKWEYIGTYNSSNGVSKEHARIVKALSMLQVTFRTRIYKNWLYEILKWFNEKKSIVTVNEKKLIPIIVTFDEYVKKLEDIILNYYDEFCNKIAEEKKKEDSEFIFDKDVHQLGMYKKLADADHLTDSNSYSKGTDTPHFLFNFIDYLYWVDSQKEKSLLTKPSKIEPFEFKYWNSVEHHLAQQYAGETDKDNYMYYINNLGNLCLISKSANSRLNDRSVQEKVERSNDSNKGPNRQIMYNETKDSENTYTWDKGKIKKHYNELLELLSKREDILRLVSE